MGGGEGDERKGERGEEREMRGRERGGEEREMRGRERGGRRGR